MAIGALFYCHKHLSRLSPTASSLPFEPGTPQVTAPNTSSSCRVYSGVWGSAAMQHISPRQPALRQRPSSVYIYSMPYKWTTQTDAQTQELQLWPHNSLSQHGMAAFVLTTFTFILIPALPLLGSVVLWGLLPFLLIAVWGIYYALRRNRRSRQIIEVLTLDDAETHLTRTDANGKVQEWDCNRYWTQVTKYDDQGPVPHYVTLKGKGREVEIGAFLSEEERIALYDDLLRALRR